MAEQVRVDVFGEFRLLAGVVAELPEGAWSHAGLGRAAAVAEKQGRLGVGLERVCLVPCLEVRRGLEEADASNAGLEASCACPVRLSGQNEDAAVLVEGDAADVERAELAGAQAALMEDRENRLVARRLVDAQHGDEVFALDELVRWHFFRRRGVDLEPADLFGVLVGAAQPPHEGADDDLPHSQGRGADADLLVVIFSSPFLFGLRHLRWTYAWVT